MSLVSTYSFDQALLEMWTCLVGKYLWGFSVISQNKMITDIKNSLQSILLLHSLW